MKIEVMSDRGHEVLGEWTREAAEAEIAALDARVQGYLRRGYSAFGATSGRKLTAIDEQCREDVVIIGPVVGG